MEINMRRRELLAATIAIGVVGSLGGCERLLTPSQTTKTKLKIAQWGQEKYLIYLPFYIAQEAGLFSKNGLEVELSFNGNDDQVYASVARGDAQFGIGDPIFAAISRNRGGDGVVVAQIVDRVALWGVAKAGEPRRDTPAAFAGARIGTFPRPSTTYTLVREMIDRNSVTGAKIIEVPIGSELALLESGGADVVMMLEPAASTAVAAGYQIVTSFPSLWGPFAFTGLTSSAEYANGHPEVVAKARTALQEALELARSNVEEATRIARVLFPNLDAAVVATAVKRMLNDKTVPQNAAVSPEGWAEAIRVRQKMGELAEGDYTKVVLN
jgi:NitT/TauT family transport system substrate-binding protein